MGTSSAFGGPQNNTPLVPTWLEPDRPGLLPIPPEGVLPNGSGQDNAAPTGPNSAPQISPPAEAPPTARRFTVARTNFSCFVGSGGSDRVSLGRALSHYVSTSSGGARRAAQRMGTSRTAGHRLLSFLSDAVAHGAQEALRVLALEGLAGRPVEEIFLGLTDYICPDGGSIDEGIARDAFIETIADLAENGVTELDVLTVDQMQTVFELYATHAIEARLCNDVGTKIIVLTSDAHTVEQVQVQLRDFIRRSVADALTAARDAMQSLTVESVVGFVDGVYGQAFRILQVLGETEASTA